MERNILTTIMKFRWFTAAALATASLFTPGLHADENEEPGRGVARISLIQGDVSVRRGDSGEWVAAAPNAPLVVEDRLLTGVNSKAELQFDSANLLRLAPNSEIRLAELEYRRYILQLAVGTISYTVLRNSEADVEVSTPAVAVRPVKRGVYRVTILPDGNTEVTVRSGEVEVLTPTGSERLKSGRTLITRGTSPDVEFQVIGAIPKDDWDQWNERRNNELERSGSYRYVPSSVYGAEDLDANGTWVYDPPYGHVWVPRTSPGWAPYRYGRWAWIDWYGWSWVSYDPWGWAPYHYGRWYMGTRGWCWWPGAMSGRHYWSPGLVAWVGFGHGGGVGVGFGSVGWIPLAPYETYHRGYGWGNYRGYGNRNSVHNSVNIVNNVNVTNIYRNARVSNGMSAVNASDFTAGRFNNVVRVNQNELQRANLVRGQLPVTPERSNLRLSDREVTGQPRSREDGRFFSRRTPSNAERVSFDDQRRGVEEISRRTFGGNRGEHAAGAPTAPSANPAGTPGRAVDAGSRRAVDSTSRPTSTENQENRGWRRVGESRTDAPARNAESSTRPADSPAANRRSSESNTGWRTFGEPRNGETVRSGQSTPRTTPRTENSTGSSDRGWRRFGEPSGSSPSVPSTTDRGAPSRRSSTPDSSTGTDSGTRSRTNDTWRRTGESSSQGSGSAAPRSGSGGERQRDSATPRSESPRREAPPARTESPRSDTPRESPRNERRSPEFDRGQSLNVSPPIVRERRSNFEPGSEPASRSEGRSSRSDGRFSGSPRFESGVRTFGGGSSRMDSGSRSGMGSDSTRGGGFGGSSGGSRNGGGGRNR